MMKVTMPRFLSSSMTLLSLLLFVSAACLWRLPLATAWKSELKEVIALAPYLREQLHAMPDDFMANLQLADGFRVLVLAERGTGASVNEMPEYWEAVHAYKRVLEINPEADDLHTVYLSLATLLHRNLQTEEAIFYHHKALEFEPENDNTHMLLGYLYETSGMYDKAQVAYSKALDLNPHNLDAHSRMVTMRKYRTVDDPFFVKLLSAYNEAVRTGAHSVDILDFALSKAFKDAKDFKRSFFHLAKGNRLTLQNFGGYEFSGHYNIASQMTQLFSPEIWGETWDLRTAGDPSSAPIFVVGMPRSGSTLVEQIISTHSTVFAGGEDTPFAPLMSKLIPEIYAKAGQSASPLFRKYGAEYVQRMLERASVNGTDDEGSSEITRFTDKHLMNFWLIGIIHMVFPNARIVHTLRDPMDTLFSCYKHRFEKGSIDFSYSQEHLAQFYVLYRAVMEHWEATVPASKLLTIRYEELVNDQETVTRRLFKHCNLTWDDRALRFYETDRQVLTHSAGQVRRPLYNGSIGAWRNFEEELLPMVSMRVLACLLLQTIFVKAMTFFSDGG
eukprot:INCI4796.2.p1 GENE.INCI4796.2~~INCI4796.2.p1  ORF type:complete len:558 (+),score=73.86 INCI4796.2:125-1798(+)